LRVVHLDTGREWRGGQAQVLTLCRGLAARGVEQVLVVRPGSPLARRAAEAGIPVWTMRMFGEFDLIAAARLRILVAERGAAIVHTHDAHAHALAWLALRGTRRVALVVSRRVDFPISHSWFSRRKYLDGHVHFFAISHGVRDVLLRGGVPPDRVRVVPSGVDAERFRPGVTREALRREFAIPEGAPIVGTIGQLVDHKDHATLVEAAALVLRQRPDARFVIVGEGALRGDLEARIARLGIGASVLLPGYRPDVETFLAGFDLFALSSHLEGLCTSVIDAMLFGLPVVATRTGGVPDLVRDGETGWLVPVRDPAELAAAILFALHEPALAKRLGEAARAHARAHFTAESLVENTLRAYEAVLRGAAEVRR
jgi:glycosyltransferase involved in cell wall biosynthesis